MTYSKPPEKLPSTDAERIYLYNTGGFASGSYKLNGNKVILHYNTSFN